MVRVIPNDHGAGHRDLDGPGLAAELTVHLDRHLGGYGHQTLGLVQHRGGDALAGSGLLDDALLLDCRVMISLKKEHCIENISNSISSVTLLLGMTTMTMDGPILMTWSRVCT